MTSSRSALTLSLLYSIPLLIWLTFSLQFIDWNTHSLQHLFQQTHNALLLLQAIALPLCFIYRSDGNWQDDALAVTHILLYPLPVITLAWLTGSVTTTVILTGFAMLTGLSFFMFLLQIFSRLIAYNNYIKQSVLSSLHLIITILVWNYRDLWRGWIE